MRVSVKLFRLDWHWEFLRVFRVMLLLDVSKDMKQGYRLLKDLFRVFAKVLPLFSLLCIFFLLISVIGTLSVQTSDRLAWGLKSFLVPLQFLNKGFDLATALNLPSQFCKTFALQSTVFSLLIGIPFNSLCVALMFKFLEKETTEEDKLQIKDLMKVKPEL
jgi:hypothetical protein